MFARTTLNWEKDLTLETLLDGYKVTINRDMENEGNDEGLRPKALILVALAGCSAMDVIPLFNKTRVRFEGVSTDVKAESSGTIPMVYITLHMTYHVQGNKEGAAKIDKVIRLSQEKYYEVGPMVKKIAPITYEILLNGEPLKPYLNDK